MNAKLLTKALAAVAVLSFTYSAAALNITAADEILGKVDPGTPAGDDNSVEQIRFLVNGHNTGNPAAGTVLGNNPADPGNEVYTLLHQYGVDLPTVPAGTLIGPKTDGTGAVNYDPSVSYSYVLGKYGNDSYIWFIGDLAQDGTIQLPTNLPGVQQSLSHTLVLIPGGNRVPDGGATAALLGLGLLGLAAIRRKS